MNNFPEELKKKNYYKGQCVYTYKQNSTNSNTEQFAELKFPALATFNDIVYSHQKDVLIAHNKKENILMLGPFSSGKTTIAVVCALKTLFDDAGTVLFVSSNKDNKELQKRMINQILKKLHYEWFVDVLNLDECAEDKYPPAIFICDIQELHSKILPNYKNYELFWRNLKLVVFDDFHDFSGNLASNSLWVVKRLKRICCIYNSNLQFIVLSEPFFNSEPYVKKFLDVKDITIVNKDSCAITSAFYNIWIPPIKDLNIVYSESDKSMSFRIGRGDFFEESFNLANESILSGMNTVIYHFGIPLGKSDKSKYQRPIEEHIKKHPTKPGNLFIGDDLNSITLNLYESGLTWKDVNIIIVAGFIGPLRALRDDLLHIGCENVLVYIVLPHLPHYQFYVNQPERELKFNITPQIIREVERDALFVINEQVPEIPKRHLLFMINETGLNDEDKQRYSDFIEELIKEEYLEKHDEAIIITEKGRNKLNEFINYSGLDLYTSSFNNFMKVKEGTNLITLCDKSEMAHYFYGGAFIKLLNKRYQITRVNLENAEISINPTESFSMTFPCTDIEEFIENTDTKQLDSYTYQEKLKVTLNSGMVSFKIGRAKNSQFLSVDRIDIFNVTPNILFKENISFLKFSGFINEYIAHTFAHLFLIALKTRFLIGEREFPKFFIKENSIYFYSSSSFGGGIFDVFLDMNILRDILERMWTIVIECPCQNGCSGCLYILECPDMDCPQNKKLDKSSIIEFLGNVLNKTQEASKYITRKFQGISDMDTLQEIKNKSINILKRKAEMSIKTVCNHRFFTDDDINQHPGWAGYCDYTNKIVAVLQGFPEADLLEIVAHEYTHNWQKEDNLNQVLKHFNAYDIDDKSNILFGGKLFSEGLAMYGAMKVLDYFGLNEKIIAIIREARASSDEYSEGAKLMWYLEGKYGLVNLLNILKTGKMIDNKTDITPEMLKEWYKNSGVYNGIVQAGTEIINNGGLICMTSNYLNKQTEDLNRLSYHLTAILECSLENKKNTIGKFITDEENKEKIWNVLREAINEAIGCYPTGNEIPCSKCKQKDYETLENVCILFKSKKYFDRIVNELHLDNF